jgi:membrane protein YdbS with pleckstrin-like domain
LLKSRLETRMNVPSGSTVERAVLFEESQLAAPWAFALVIGVPAFLWYLALTVPAPGTTALRAGAAFATFVGLFVALTLRMKVEVTPAALRVEFGWLPLYRDSVPISRIESAQAVEYHPLVQHGGWGLRGSLRQGGLLSARGHEGVQLRLDNGKVVIIGSQRASQLTDALARARGV